MRHPAEEIDDLLKKCEQLKALKLAKQAKESEEDGP